jgi:hypothetical protein
MNRLLNIRIIENIFKIISPKQQTAGLGRWNLKDSGDIKGSLANMDCCGDNLCGSPEKYSETVNSILEKSNVTNA